MDSSMGADFCFSSDADFPNKVKLRKRLPLWILEVTLGVDHDRHRHTLKPTCTVKDKFLKGVINIDVTKNRLEYKKVCGMPFLGQLVIDAGVNYRNPLKHPRIGVSVSTCGAGATAAITNGDSITFDRRFSVGKRVSLEFLGEVRQPGSSTNAFDHPLQARGDGPWNVHLKEVNAIIRI